MCVYVCMYVCMYVHTYVCMYVCMYELYVCTCTFVYMYVRMNVCMCVCVYVCTYVHMYVCMSLACPYIVHIHLGAIIVVHAYTDSVLSQLKDKGEVLIGNVPMCVPEH